MRLSNSADQVCQISRAYWRDTGRRPWGTNRTRWPWFAGAIPGAGLTSGCRSRRRTGPAHSTP
eukprot:5971444-Alexandrium_andersonii.AAC.1